MKKVNLLEFELLKLFIKLLFAGYVYQNYLKEKYFLTKKYFIEIDDFKNDAFFEEIPKTSKFKLNFTTVSSELDKDLKMSELILIIFLNLKNNFNVFNVFLPSVSENDLYFLIPEHGVKRKDPV